MILKNYTKKEQKLPLFGIGPALMLGIGAFSAVSMILAVYVFKIGELPGIWIIISRIIGAVFIMLGVLIWFFGAVKSDIDDNIIDNRLSTNGIFAYVRNPMYSGIWMMITGISCMWHNLFAIPVFLINWLILTVVLKQTEEKWLLSLHGAEYEEYKKHVNRLIPCIRAYVHMN
ncbi:MAG: isoprenylcysteine carboxylmethyltransferase family protein [Butyrivibrio sp.]|uniref:methyltransferase family protein n=1 Tax=Butyrivibrio sp. TaxID=28121 RepID=UPI0025D240C2|nr:isoprenylcysteine carboxylmethyltransferase family protein [Butyrivibrio sp.]MCR5771709.1 isoprenylcysteine carboxylmethyltransferase family protein [Butyrivibrio sp.]